MSDAGVDRGTAGPAAAGPASATGRNPEARIGTIVDKYSIVRVLGAGGMGVVYEARHATLARRFAIKFLLPAAAVNAEAVRRFENEAKAAGGLEHPNLAAVTDFGRHADGAPYLVMEYLAGEDCAKVLGRLGPLPAARAANIVLQACRGLAVAHDAGIIHRDLKPANLFLTDAGDGSDLVKVLDFGIAKLRAAEAATGTATGTATGQTFGTAHYMSPEQARGAGEVDARTDVWSLGVVLYELLAGRRPFEDGTFLHVIYQILSTEPPGVGTWRRGLPASLAAVIAKAMAKDPRERFQSVRALGEALTDFARDGRSAGVVQRSQGLAPTMATPATGIRPGGQRIPSERALARGIEAERDAEPARVEDEPDRPRRGARRILLAAVVSVAIVGGLAAAWSRTRGGPSARAGGARDESRVSEPAMPAALRASAAPAGSEVQAPSKAPTTLPPAIGPASAVEGAPRAPRILPGAPEASVPKAEAGGRSSTVREPARRGPTKAARTVSEHVRYGSDSVFAPSVQPVAAAAAPRELPAAPVKAAVTPALESSGRPIDIDEKSPYAR